MKKNIIIQVIKNFIASFLALVLLSIVQLIWWIVTWFDPEKIWRFLGFTLFISISFVASFLVIWAYYISYSLFWNKRHITSLSIFFQTTLIALICYFSTELVQDMLFSSHRTVTDTGSIISYPLESYFPIAYLILVSSLYFSIIFKVRGVYENYK